MKSWTLSFCLFCYVTVLVHVSIALWKWYCWVHKTYKFSGKIIPTVKVQTFIMGSDNKLNIKMKQNSLSQQEQRINQQGGKLFNKKKSSWDGLLWQKFDGCQWYFSVASPFLCTLILLYILWVYMSPIKRICVFEHSVMTNFNCACPAIQRGQGSGFLSEGSSWLTACMSEQQRFWRDCADAQARLNLRCSHRQ